MVDENESWEDCAYRVFSNPMTNPYHRGEIQKEHKLSYNAYIEMGILNYITISE